MTFLSRGYGNRLTGLERNILEHDFFEDDKSGIPPTALNWFVCVSAAPYQPACQLLEKSFETFRALNPPPAEDCLLTEVLGAALVKEVFYNRCKINNRNIAIKPK